MAGCTLTASVSLLANNLTVSPSGWAACVHNAVGTTGGGKLLLTNLPLGGTSKDGPEVSQATSIRYLELATGTVLVVSSSNGTQVYNEDASALLGFVPVTDAPDGEVLRQHQGCCLVPAFQHIVLGTWKGSLLPIAGAGGLAPLPESNPCSPATAVADVCYSELAGTVISAHTNGELRIWTVNDTGPYVNANAVATTGQAPTRIATLGPRLLVAFGPGPICIYDVITLEIQAELSAHARWTSAVQVREDLGWILTVGEDTVLNIWQVDEATGRIGLYHSAVVTDKLLTGVALCGSEVFVAAYDTSELTRVVV